ncbi:MAG: LysR family transcriptional regulator [Shimia sp.]|uniref:LysR substrate-binding domain-containing protein n=1 Tax=Shimia sp. TaxID=1954381 RepID=UPI003B8D1139
MTRINLNSLSMFVAAARHGSFRRAAEALHLTQGAVAQQVRNLEKQTQIQLFHRLPQGLSLTEEGRAYHETVSAALQQIETATRALKPATQSITLSVPPSLASKWLVPRLANFAAQHPDISLHIHASETRTDFAKDPVDIAIRQGEAPTVPNTHCEPLAPLDLVAVASPSTSATSLSLTDTVALPLIEDGHNRWKTLCEDNDLPYPDTVLSFNQTALAIDAAITGQGVTLAPRLLVQDALNQGHLIVLWHPTETSEAYHLLHPTSRHRHRNAVVSWLKQEVATGPNTTPLA